MIDGALDVEGEVLEPGPLLYLGQGRDRVVVRHVAGPEDDGESSAAPARLLVLGGEPLREDLLMWWNFVGRTHDEVAAARADWENPDRRAARFGVVPAHGEDRIPAPPLPNVRLTPRRRRR
ncbi:pirin-like C-terminal cupin domain-containing protein [Litorihabitans aurantiacus]|uniref:pirin-like C-terminal cupin domain-containing protein n=1 Tax=Litorihabitans aurantiacus TaxID=1930061 RepID=UPI0032AFBD8A